MTDEEWKAIWLWRPTQAEHDARAAREGRAKVAAELAGKLADWRAAHPEATCRDAVAVLLMDLEERFG